MEVPHYIDSFVVPLVLQSQVPTIRTVLFKCNCLLQVTFFVATWTAKTDVLVLHNNVGVAVSDSVNIWIFPVLCCIFMLTETYQVLCSQLFCSSSRSSGSTGSTDVPAHQGQKPDSRAKRFLILCGADNLPRMLPSKRDLIEVFLVKSVIGTLRSGLICGSRINVRV